jgi:hypothetical protein
MTIKTVCYCDCCDKDLTMYMETCFLVTVMAFRTIHFCDYDCMRAYLEKRWHEMDEEKARLI